VLLPGVGRKTANVVLGVAFNAPEGVVVDTHVQRISQRLGWTKHDEPEKIERDLMRLFPREQWDAIGHTLIFHGRRICSARKPACAACAVNDACPSAFKAAKVDGKRRARRPKTAATPKQLSARQAAARTKKRDAGTHPRRRGRASLRMKNAKAPADESVGLEHPRQIREPPLPMRRSRRVSRLR
jgi:endonuclease-3